MSVSLSIHARRDILKVDGYVTSNPSTPDDVYNVINLHSTEVDVTLFANEEQLQDLILQLQKIKREYKKATKITK
jgi:hypothetical protein